MILSPYSNCQSVYLSVMVFYTISLQTTVNVDKWTQTEVVLFSIYLITNAFVSSISCKIYQDDY